MLDWATISSLATAGGTLVLAVATFASVRSSNRSARLAERSLLVGMRPVLGPSRLQDDPQKVGFFDSHWLVVPGGCGAAEATDEAVYLAIAVRNVGTGIAVLHGWALHLDSAPNPPFPKVDAFHQLTRDIYVAPGDVGFWQGALRDPGTDEFAATRRLVEHPETFAVDVLYGDQNGGQRSITRYRLVPAHDRWLATVGRIWHVDGPQAR